MAANVSMLSKGATAALQLAIRRFELWSTRTSFRRLAWTRWLIPAAYVAAQWRAFFGAATVPDENWFLEVGQQAFARAMQHGWLSAALTQRNELGYGSTYWLLLAACHAPGINPLLVARAVILGLEALTLGLLVRSPQWPRLLAAVFLASSKPMWWYGKLIGPELLSAFLGFLGAWLADGGAEARARRRLGWVSLGFSVGLKLTALPVCAFAFLRAGKRLPRNNQSNAVHAERSRGTAPTRDERACDSSTYFAADAKGSRRQLLAMLLLLAIGYTLANPAWLTGSSPLEPGRPFGPAPFSAARFSLVWTGALMTWDAIPSGSFFSWCVFAPAFLVLLFQCRFRLRHQLFPLLAAFGLTGLMVMSTPSYWGWYWFNTFLLLPFAIAKFPSEEPRTGRIATGLVVALNAVWSMPSGIHQYRNRMEHERNLAAMKSLVPCLEAKVSAEFYFAELLDMTELPPSAELEAWAKRRSPTVRYRRAGEVADCTRIQGARCELGLPQLVVYGDRLTLRDQGAPDLANLVGGRVAGAIGAPVRIQSLGECGPFHVRVLELAAQGRFSPTLHSKPSQPFSTDAGEL